jgi:hypothetical protein
MKKILSIFFLLFAVFAGKGYAQVTFNPPVFTADDQVTMRVDLTGTPVVNLPEKYIWIWCETFAGGGNDGVVNGTWTNSSAAAKLTQVSGNIYSFTFTGTQLFNRTPGELKRFGFLVKAKDGSSQTPDFKWFNFDPLVFTEGEFRVFPSKVSQSDIVTVYLRTSLSSDVAVQRMAPQTVTISLFDLASNQVGSSVTIPVRNEGGNLYAATFVPERLIALPAGTKLKFFRYKFNGNGFNATGGVITVTSAETQQDFLDLR